MTIIVAGPFFTVRTPLFLEVFLRRMRQNPQGSKSLIAAGAVAVYAALLKQCFEKGAYVRLFRNAIRGMHLNSNLGREEGNFILLFRMMFSILINRNEEAGR